jgi:uncharacterized repeat protein (TIGR04138 family)
MIAKGVSLGAMTELQFADEILGRLQEQDPRFHSQGYLFVLSALQSVVSSLQPPRHISGGELAHGVRDLALERFGPLARTVLEHWGIHATEDVGRIVFALVECGVLVKQPEDRLEDFCDVFDFEEAFERSYPWGSSR